MNREGGENRENVSNSDKNREGINAEILFLFYVKRKKLYSFCYTDDTF